MTPEQLDLAVWPTFARMTARGIMVDPQKLIELRTDVAVELEAQEAALQAYAGCDLNPYSPQQVGAWLVRTGLAGRRKRTTGAIETGVRALSLLTDRHPAPAAILECRGLAKLISTFIDPVLEIVEHSPDRAVHPMWRLAGRHSKEDENKPHGGTRSGRPSCERPNLLAFPSRVSNQPGMSYTRFGKRVKDAFIARPGFKLISCDYSQIEPRIAAALSKDPGLMDVYLQKRDIYADMARRIFRMTETDAQFKADPLKTTHRQPAKIILLGCVLYGMGPDSLYEDFIKFGCGTPSKPNFDMAACEDFVRRRFEPYPMVGALVERCVREAATRGGVAITYGGRTRALPALLLDGRTWPASSMRAEAERQCFNHLIQGTAQEKMKEGMIRVEQSRLPVYPLLQIYDELVLEVRESEAPQVLPDLIRAMSSHFEGIDIVASGSVADSWGALK